VTSGIVSALARTQVSINDLNFFIQTDAAINPGNSGGALIGLDGKLVGINSAIYSKNGGSVGIGFAIPSNMVRFVIAELSSGGRLKRPWFGAVSQTVTSDIAATIGLRLPIGILVSNVYPGGPADRAGIRVGDVVAKIGGKRINDPQALKFRIASRRLGGTVKITIIRHGNEKILLMPVEAPPEVPPKNITELSGAQPLQGATVANLSPALADEMGLNLFTTGVVVLKVRGGTTAQRFAFKPGDIIMNINGTDIKSVAGLQKIIVRSGKQWRLSIFRGGRTLTLSVQ
ncbi:MAG: PDZ domain-containing protein, partial [Rhodospirillales bacterium]|nr:PDZ domain-containing protein [Rhodospirillales bacterium]